MHYISKWLNASIVSLGTLSISRGGTGTATFTAKPLGIIVGDRNNANNSVIIQKIATIEIMYAGKNKQINSLRKL